MVEEGRSEFPHATVTVITNLRPPTRVLFSVIGLSMCPGRSVMSSETSLVRGSLDSLAYFWAFQPLARFLALLAILRLVTFVFLHHFDIAYMTPCNRQNCSSDLFAEGKPAEFLLQCSSHPLRRRLASGALITCITLSLSSSHVSAPILPKCN